MILKLTYLKERGLFKWLKDNIYFDLEKARDEHSRWDCKSDHYRHRIELKCRRKHYPTMMIEKSKYDALVSMGRRSGNAPIYINSTPEGIFAWDLSLISLEWTLQACPKTTDFRDNEKILKEVSYLNINTAKKLYTR